MQNTMSARRLLHEARAGLMRAWIEILRARHPGVIWLPVEREPLPNRSRLVRKAKPHDLASAAG
jgi:hypothetical protein